VAVFRAALAVALLATGLGACALVEGLSQYSKEDCSNGCGEDGGFDAAAPVYDGGATPDGADSGFLRADASDGETGGLTPDGGEGGLGPDTGSTAAEAGADTGACGVQCATPGCCGSACETGHSDGVGQSYFDCNPPSTYTEMAAFSACTAYALTVGSNATSCVGPLYCKGSSAPTICFTNSSGSCATYCWQYSGVYAGAGPGTVWDCACPAHMVGSWN
jgi:hypothetical protein